MIIGHLIEDIPIATEETSNYEIDEIFKANPTLRGIVVCRDEQPIAFLSKTRFYQKIGSKYGYDLYFKRSCTLLCKYQPFVVKYNSPIVQVSTAAMQRHGEELYEEIIVTKNGKYAGVVDIRKLLLNLVESQVQFASYLNPLSKLPGNEIINQKLQDALSLPAFSVLYFDIDKFKPYNDYYGFKQGDNLLLFIIDLLKTEIHIEEHFLGHIGGDDFIAILPNDLIEQVCTKILERFDHEVLHYYQDEDLKNPPLVAARDGGLIPLPVCSLSIAVVQKTSTVDSLTVEELANFAAKTKKKCKEIKGSCYLIETLHSHTTLQI